MATNQARLRIGGDDDEASNFPYDIVETILARLPVKSVLRFKSVCKWLNSIISCPRFMKMHEHSCPRIHFLVQERYISGRQFYSIEFKNRRLQIDEFLGDPFEHSKIVCSCKGIVLLKFFYELKFALWNPFTRVHATIPFPQKVYSFLVSIGLCYDSNKDDYKVVVVHVDYTYSIFSCKNETWSERRELPNHLMITDIQGLCVDGGWHWLCTEDDEDDTPRKVLHFDPRDDKLYESDLPNIHSLVYEDSMILSCFRGHLCLCVQCEFTGTIYVWAMENNDDRTSWEVLFTIKELGSGYFVSLYPINDNLILAVEKSCQFVIYDTFEERIIGKLPDNRGREVLTDAVHYLCLPVVPCKENLSFPITRTS